MNMTLEQFNKYCLDNQPDNDELAKIFRDDDCDAGQIIFYLEDRWNDTDFLNFINEYEFIFSDEIYFDTVSDFFRRFDSR